MTLRTPSMLECRNCGAGAPLDAHFCPQCEHILPLPRHGDYFTFFRLPRKLVIEPADLEQRFRALSRKFHPDYFYNAPPAERRASLERSSYLNDAYRALKQPVTRIEYLLNLEGLNVGEEASGRHGASGSVGATHASPGRLKVPPALLEEVFALNEELDEIREAREAGGDPEALRVRLDAARKPIERKQEEHERQLQELSVEWDARHERGTLDALREQLLERNYLRNLLATIDREVAGLGLKA